MAAIPMTPAQARLLFDKQTFNVTRDVLVTTTNTQIENAASAGISLPYFTTFERFNKRLLSHCPGYMRTNLTADAFSKMFCEAYGDSWYLCTSVDDPLFVYAEGVKKANWKKEALESEAFFVMMDASAADAASSS